MGRPLEDKGAAPGEGGAEAVEVQHSQVVEEEGEVGVAAKRLKRSGEALAPNSGTEPRPSAEDLEPAEPASARGAGAAAGLMTCEPRPASTETMEEDPMSKTAGPPKPADVLPVTSTASTAEADGASATTVAATMALEPSTAARDPRDRGHEEDAESRFHEEDLMGDWVRDGGRRHEVIATARSGSNTALPVEGPRLQFKAEDGKVVPIVEVGGSWQLNGFLLLEDQSSIDVLRWKKPSNGATRTWWRPDSTAAASAAAPAVAASPNPIPSSAEPSVGATVPAELQEVALRAASRQGDAGVPQGGA